MRRQREQEVILSPDGPPRAVILYHHGYTERHDRLLRDPDRTVIDALLEAGMLIASCSAAGDSWGSRSSVEANWLLWEKVRRPGLALCHLGVSMGCLVALNCAADVRFPSLAVACIAPVCDVESVRPFRPVSSDAMNPIDRDPAAWRGISLRFWAADEEAPVSKVSNADRFADHVAAHAKECSVESCTGNHTSPSQYQPGDVVAFILRALRRS